MGLEGAEELGMFAILNVDLTRKATFSYAIICVCRLWSRGSALKFYCKVSQIAKEIQAVGYKPRSWPT
jgi:hypothetical protein